MVTVDVERLSDTSAKLTITIEEATVRRTLDDAARRLANEVRIPGFRPGRVPRKLLEKRLGTAAIVQEAARGTFADFFSEAVEQAGLQVVGPPEFEVQTFADGDEGQFTATVDVLPTFEVPDYSGLEIAHPEWEVTDDDVQASLDDLRERFAEVETVDRPIQHGDLAVVTITGRRKGSDEVVEEASGSDLMYEIPAEVTDSELDRHLVGSKAGDVIEFDDVLGSDYPDGLAGQELHFHVIVKEVKARSLPELDDDFAVTASEFDTLDELVADIRGQLTSAKLAFARNELRNAVVQAVADLVEIPLPESLVEEEKNFRLGRIVRQAEHAEIPFDQYLGAMGTTVQELVEQVEQEAATTVKAQLLLDAAGREAGIRIGQEDLSREIVFQAQRLGRAPQEVAEIMLKPERVGALYADAFRRRAIDHLLEHVTVTGAPPEPAAGDADVDEGAAPAEEE